MCCLKFRRIRAEFAFVVANNKARAGEVSFRSSPRIAHLIIHISDLHDFTTSLVRDILSFKARSIMANSQPQTPAKKQKPTRKADPVRKSSLRSSSRSSPALPSSKPMHHSPSPTVASLPDQTRSPQAEDGEQASDLPSGSILDERSSVAAPDTDRDLDIPTRAPMWSWADSGEKASVGGEDESTLSNTGITRDPSNSPDFQYFAREANEDQISSGDEDEGATSPTVIQTDLSGTRETQRAEHKAKEERDVSQSTSSATASGLEAVSTSTAEVTAKRKLDVIDVCTHNMSAQMSC